MLKNLKGDYMKSKKKNKIKNLTDADYLNYINKISGGETPIIPNEKEDN